MHQTAIAYVGIGSNLGNRKQYIELALSKLPGIIAVSPIYETEPIGGPDNQGSYLNCVAKLQSELDPYELLAKANEIEQLAKRERNVKNGPRTLDIDILLYDDLVQDDPKLTIPHPRMFERCFVLKPLSDIAPDKVKPSQLNKCEGLVKLFEM